MDALNVKMLIGNILRDSDRYSSKLEEKKRCWRIEYSAEAQFHMDITPAIPDNPTTASIHVTDKKYKDSLDMRIYTSPPHSLS
jgi:hypothetical protein